MPGATVILPLRFCYRGKCCQAVPRNALRQPQQQVTEQQRRNSEQSLQQTVPQNSLVHKIQFQIHITSAGISCVREDLLEPIS
jgi:hypothetical protein